MEIIMKKTKFFSALTLVLMLLLTFSSCGTGAFLENINFDYKSTPAYSGAVEVTNISGLAANHGNTLVYLYDTTGSGNTVHKIYNIDSANVVYTQELGAVDSRSLNVNIESFGEQDLFTVKVHNNYEFESISLYDQNGTLIATSQKDTTPENICNELIVFDNAVYTLGKNGFEKTADLDGTLKRLPTSSGVDTLHVSKKYVYAVDDDEVTVYTQKGEFKYGYTAPSYAEDTYISVIDNGKIAVQYKKELPDQSTKFDLIKNDVKYDLVTLIIDPANGKVKSKNVDFLIGGLSSSYELSRSDTDVFKDDFNGNIAVIVPIEEDGTVNENSYEIVELYNDLKIRASFSGILDYDTNLGEFEIVCDGVMAVADDFGNLVFIKKNGKKLASFKNDSLHYSERFIVTDTAIYDYSINTLYEYEKNGYEFVTLSKMFVILRKDSEYFKFTIEMQAPEKINGTNTGDKYEGVKLGMYCVKRGEGYAYLNAIGGTVATFSGKITASYVTESGNALVMAGGKYYKLTQY